MTMVQSLACKKDITRLSFGGAERLERSGRNQYRSNYQNINGRGTTPHSLRARDFVALKTDHASVVGTPDP
jgi:hypothetical protein